MGTAGLRRALLLLAGVLAVTAPAGAANRLAGESSPYLLQHADNPVDWYPWGDEAFARAAAEDKPVLLSIGYSTCHWCHVMERESFADPETAALLNAAFVCVKVDREERPDIDAFYMAVCQMMTGSGGWPLTLMLTPDRRPFFAATYLPKTTRFGHTGLMELVPRIRQLWTEDREELLRASARILDGLEAMTPVAGESAPGPDLLERAFRSLRASFDAERGGFGGAPKFPPVHALRFLLRYHARHGSPEALGMVRRTLDAMRDGGIHDHLGGGFHRYATDAAWRVPHFEKMLTDQALLALAYTEAWQVTGEASYRAVAEGTLDYLLRDLAHPGGGFYAAEDADSEGEEGTFYLWTRAEVLRVLGKRDGEAFCRLLGVEEGGNVEDPASGRATGKNILWRESGVRLPERQWERVRRKLLAARDRRVHPHRDGKVLADWNGLAVAAFARAGRAFGESRFVAAAEGAAAFIDGNLTGEDGRLLHRWAAGKAGIDAFLDDHAFLALGRLELYAATGDPAHLRRALELAEAMVARFGDPADGGFFLVQAGPGAPPVRTKELFDGAVPSGHAVAVEVLLRLAVLTGRSDLAERAWTAVRFASPTAERAPSGHAHLLSALDLGFGPSVEVVIVGRPGAKDTRAMLGELASGFRPSVSVLFRPETGHAPLDAIAPFTATMEMLDGKATAYVCRGGACDLPVTGAEAMMERIRKELGR